MLQCKTHGPRPHTLPAAPRRRGPIRWAAWGVAALLATTAGGAPGRDAPGAASAPTPPALMPTGAPALAMQALAIPDTGRLARPTLEGVIMFSANKLATA